MELAINDLRFLGRQRKKVFTKFFFLKNFLKLRKINNKKKSGVHSKEKELWKYKFDKKKIKIEN